MSLRKKAILLAFLSGFAPLPLAAQDAAPMSGSVMNVDLTSGIITISHDPNEQLKLGRSTDTFRVSEPIMLNAIRPGTQIKFAADRINGQLTITKILTD
jgi:Cu(I)/Ag(I) efflux system periplasmic protein CusF